MRLKKAEREFIAYHRVCRVAAVGKDRRPHNVPVCPILEGDRIYFGSVIIEVTPIRTLNWGL